MPYGQIRTAVRSPGRQNKPLLQLIPETWQAPFPVYSEHHRRAPFQNGSGLTARAYFEYLQEHYLILPKTGVFLQGIRSHRMTSSSVSRFES